MAGIPSTHAASNRFQTSTLAYGVTSLTDRYFSVGK